MPNASPPAWERRRKSSTGWQYTKLPAPSNRERLRSRHGFSLYSRQEFERCEHSITTHFEKEMAQRYGSRGVVREFERAIGRLRQWRDRDVSIPEIDTTLLNEFERWLIADGTDAPIAQKLVLKVRFISIDWDRRQNPRPMEEPPVNVEPEPPVFVGRVPDLYSILERYVVFREVSPGAKYQLRHSVDLFSAFLGHEATIEDLTDVAVSSWLQKMPLAPRSVAGHRGNLLSLWKLASDEHGIIPPKRVRKIRKPDPMPISWTMQELRAVITQCEALEGCFTHSGVPKALYCTTLVRFAYETGLRRSDVWQVTRDQIRSDGSIFLLQHKTGNRHIPKIRLETLNGIIRLQRDPPLANPYQGDKAWYKFWKRHVIEPAGVRPGAMHQLRRTGATHVARTSGIDAARRFLGHRTPTMVNHYVDESISMPDSPMPPSF